MANRVSDSSSAVGGVSQATCQPGTESGVVARQVGRPVDEADRQMIGLIVEIFPRLAEKIVPAVRIQHSTRPDPLIFKRRTAGRENQNRLFLIMVRCHAVQFNSKTVSIKIHSLDYN